MSDSQFARAGQVAFILYRGGAKGDDGQLDESLVDDNSQGQPLAVPLGMHRVPAGIEEALYEMEVGEERTLDIPAELGYGVYNQKEVQWYPRAMLPRGYDIKVGDILTYNFEPTKEVRPARVIEATEDGVKIDMNHPFAGKDLVYWVKLVKLV